MDVNGEHAAFKVDDATNITTRFISLGCILWDTFVANEKVQEIFGLQGCTTDNYSQVWSAFPDLFQDAE